MKDICYKNNYLVEVVARLDFAKPIEALMEPVLPADIHAEIKKHYSIFEPNKITRHGVQISDASVKSEKEEIQQWVYHGEERDKSITISAHFIVVTFKVYRDFNNFKEHIISPIRKIIELEKNVQIQRTGLRFVNIYNDFIKSLSDIKQYFPPMLSCSFENLIDQESCSRNFLISEYLYDEIKLRMQTGIYNPDYPAKIKKIDFIVDLDAFIDTPHVVTDVEGFFDEIHDKIQDKFESCITEEMRGLLNE